MLKLHRGFTSKFLQEWLYWFILSAFLGLLQFWIVIFADWVRASPVDWDSHFKSSAFLFFCSGTIVSSASDKWREMRDERSAFFQLWFIVLPIILVLAIAVYYLINYLNPSQALLARHKIFQICLMTFALVYSTIAKFWIRHTENVDKV
jgi:hypothetical protein